MRIAVFDNQQSGGGRRAAQELMKALRGRGHALHLYNCSTAAEEFLPLAPMAHEVTPIALSEPPVGFLRRLPYGPLVAAVRLHRRLEAAGREAASAIDEDGHDVAFVQECRYTAAPHLLRYLATPSAFYLAEPKRGLYEYVSSNQRTGGLWGSLGVSGDLWGSLGVSGGLRGTQGNLGGLRGTQSSVLSPQSSARSTQHAARAAYHRSLKLVLNGFWRGVERANGRCADAILTCSHYSRELIWRAYGVFAWTSHLGVDTERFRPDGGPREHLVASIGELVPRKAHDFVVEAVGAIPEARRPRVVLAANAAWPEERRYVEQLAERLEVRLEVLIDPGDGALVELCNRAGVLAYPPVMEPFGLVALEAMACGTPMVGVCEGGVRESVVVGVGGLLVDRNVDEFAGAIDSVLSDEGLARRLSQRGRETVNAYWTWGHACDRLESHLARTLRRQP